MHIGLKTVLLTTACLMASPALAQESTEQQPATPAAEEAAQPQTSDGDIVVTARRVAERLQDVPLAVTAVGANTLREQNVVRVDQLRLVAPSLQIVPATDGTTRPTLSIRGQLQARVLVGQDPSVAIYISDFVNTRASGMNQSLYDIASVQVLRGPQGTLFGRNTTGGAVLITPKAPITERLEGYVDLRYGNFNALDVNGAINLPISDDAAIRIAGSRQSSSGYVRNLFNGQRLYADDNWSGRVSLLLRPAEGLENVLMFDTFHSSSDGAQPAVILGIPGSVAAGDARYIPSVNRQIARDNIYQIEIDQQSFENTDVNSLINTTRYEVSDQITLKNIIGYREAEEHFAFNPTGGLSRVVNSFPDIDTRWWSEEFQVQGRHGSLEWITGLYYYHESGLELSSVPGFGSRIGGSVDNDSYSAYLQGTYRFSPQFSATAGARYTIDHRRATMRGFNPVANTCRVFDENDVRLPITNCARDFATTYKEPTWNISLEYKPGDAVLLYVAHRRGYRAGGYNIRGERGAQLNPFLPEIVYDVEGGVKADWSLGGMPVRTNLAVYNQWYSNIQRSVAVFSNGSVTSVVFNAASARIKGFEAEISIRPARGLQISGFFALVDADYRRFIVPATGADASGSRFFLVPRNSGSVTASYTTSLPPGGELSLQATYYAQSGFELNDINEPGGRASGYDLINARLEWRHVGGSGFDAALWVQNLGNEEYFTSGNSSQSLGYVSGWVGPPRTYGFELRYSF